MPLSAFGLDKTTPDKRRPQCRECISEKNHSYKRNGRDAIKNLGESTFTTDWRLLHKGENLVVKTNTGMKLSGKFIGIIQTDNYRYLNLEHTAEKSVFSRDREVFARTAGKTVGNKTMSIRFGFIAQVLHL